MTSNNAGDASVDDLVDLVAWDIPDSDDNTWSLVAHAPDRHVRLVETATSLARRGGALALLAPRSDKARNVECRARDLEHTCDGLEREFTFRVGLLVGRWSEQHPNEKRLDNGHELDRIIAEAARSAEAGSWGSVAHVERLDKAICEIAPKWLVPLSGAFGNLTESDLVTVILKATETLGRQSAREHMAYLSELEGAQ